MRTISVDDEVYLWLQRNAKPFEDTPNTVLRRLANLSDEASSSATASVTESALDESGEGMVQSYPLSGSRLNKDWGVGAEHALYHKDGCWYGNLTAFPGAYFDPEGYVLFNTEEEYRSCPNLKIGARTNLICHLSEFENYKRMKGEI
jgi:hypothetical protein